MIGLFKAGAILGGAAAIAFSVGFLVSQIRGWENDIRVSERGAVVAEQQQAILDAQEEARIAREERDVATARAQRDFASRSQKARAEFDRQLANARAQNATLDMCLNLPPVPLSLRPQTAPSGSLRD